VIREIRGSSYRFPVIRPGIFLRIG
jgi:hypothetical protein